MVMDFNSFSLWHTAWSCGFKLSLNVRVYASIHQGQKNHEQLEFANDTITMNHSPVRYAKF